jgi:tetratricopeptide (TPR) repeat protein
MNRIRCISIIFFLGLGFNSYSQVFDSAFISEITYLSPGDRIEYCTKALETNQDAIFYFYRAEAFGQLNKFDQAYDDYSNAIKFKPDYAKAFFQRSCLSAENIRFDDAIADITRALDLEIELYKELYDPFCPLLKLAEYENAFEEITKLIESQPNDPSLFILQGILHEISDEAISAIDDYNQALKINRNLDLIYARRGILFFHEKNYNAAIIEFLSAVKYSSNNSDYLFGLGLSQAVSNYFDLALTNFQKANQISPSSKIYTHIGICYWGKDKYKDSKPFFESAIKIDSSNFRPYLCLAVWYNFQGNAKMMIQYSNKAMVLQPTLKNVESMSYDDILYLFYKDIDEIDPLSIYKGQSKEAINNNER